MDKKRGKNRVLITNKLTMRYLSFCIILFMLLTLFSVVSASDPPTVKNICHFPTDDVSDDYISKEITSDDTVIIFATVISYEYPQESVILYWDDGSEHSMEMTYSYSYWCYTAEIGQFDAGTTVTYYIVATDTASQTTTSDTYSFTVNSSEPVDTNEPPTISIDSPTNQSTINDTTPTIKASYSDPDGIDTDSVTLTIDDAIVDSIITATSVTYTPTTNMTYGEHNIKVEVSDILGNPSTEEWSFTIEESESIPEQEDENDEENNDVDGKDEETPGFELILVVFAIALILFWKQKRD